MTKRAQRITESRVWTQTMDRIELLERERIYCGHGRDHIYETLRIAGILLEREGRMELSELLECAVLLHDIGRGAEYENGTPHHIASALIGEDILRECGFETDEIDLILPGIIGHRQSVMDELPKTFDQEKREDALLIADILKKADHFSRHCFSCDAADTCKWPAQKRNSMLFS